MKARISIAGAALVAGGANAAEFLLEEGRDLIGEPVVIEARYEDTFVSLAREHNVGYEALRRANPGVDAWLPGEGTEIVIPKQYVLPAAPRRGIVVNLPELRLYYFPDGDGGRVITHPISIGRMDWGTPLGRTTVVAKARNPSWYPPQSIREEHAARNDILPAVVPPGPDNPLGKHALRLGLPGYLIHGTNKPSGVGMRVTHGCIRMFPEDIEALFELVEPGTEVLIVNQPYKIGWGDDGLYLEAHLPLGEKIDDGAADAEGVAVDVEGVAVDGEGGAADGEGGAVDGEGVAVDAEGGEVDGAFAEADAADGVADGDVVDADVAMGDRWDATELTRAFVAATEERRGDVRWDFAESVMRSARGVPQFVSVAPVTADADDTAASESQQPHVPVPN